MAEGYKPPAWLTAKVDQRLALMAEEFGKYATDEQIAEMLAKYGVMMTPLTEPAENATEWEREQWDHSCDNCGKYCPHTLIAGSMTRDRWGIQIIITFGVCPDCQQAEARGR